MKNDGSESLPRNASSTRYPLLGSIRGRLYLLLLSAIIPVMLVQGVYIYSGFMSRKENVSQANLEMSRAVAGTFDEFVKDILRHEAAIGANFTMSRSLSATEMNQILELNKAEYPAVRNFNWISPEGRIIASSLAPAVDTDLSDRDYIQKIISGREWSISGLLLSRVTGKPIFTINRAIFRDGNLIGIVMASIHPEKLEDVLAINLAEDEVITIFDDNGMAVYRSPKTAWSFEDRKFLDRHPAIIEALEGKEVTGICLALDTGDKQFVAFSPVSSAGWVASVGRSKDAVMLPIMSQLLHEVGLFFLIIIAVFMGAFILSERIAGSVRRLLNHALALGGGDVRGPIEESGPAELKALASAFNSMAEKVIAREKALKASQERLLAVLEAVPARVYLQAPDYSIKFANCSAKEAFGELEGKHCYEKIKGRTEPCEDCGVLRTFSTQTPQEYECTFPCGKWCSVHTHPFTDIDGSPVVLKMSVDISERKQAQEALRESESRYRELVQNANSAIIRIKHDGTISFFNEYAQAFFGYSEEEVIGKHASILLPEKDSAGVDLTALVQDVVSNPKCLVNNINENICRDGARVWMAWTNKAIVDESGKVTEILSVGTDITERKKAEEQVRLTLESIADGFIACDADWRFIYVNSAAERLLGINREAVLGISHWKVYPRTLGTQIESEYRLAASGEVRDFEYLFESWGRWFHIRCYPREGGGVSIYFEDITERKLAELALRESRAKLKAALVSMTDVVLISDAEMKLIEFNDAFATWHHRVEGMDPHENILVEFPDIVDIFLPNGEPAPLDMWPIRRALRGEAVRDAEYTVRSKSTGESWVVSFSFGPIRGQDGVIAGAVMVARDVTERKRVEEVLRNSEEELRFLSSKLLSAQEEERRRIAGELHDSLGSSLAAIKIGLENIRGQIDQSEVRPELLNNPIAWTQHAINEIRRLMTELRPAVLDDMGIIAALQWFFRQYRTTYPVIHVEVEIGIEEQDVPEPLKITIFRISQEAFHNIAKHSKAEYVDFSLIKRDSAIELTIEDNGDGFDPEAVLSKISERRGLGLTSMKERAELSGGSFTIKSVPGTGTIVNVIWKLENSN